MNKIYSDERPPIPGQLKRLYLLGFKAGIVCDTVAFPVFWWELHLQNRDAAEALNRDVSDTLNPTKLEVGLNNDY